MLGSLKTRWLVITISTDIGLTLLALILAHWLRLGVPGTVYLEDFSFVALEEDLFFSFPILAPIVILIWLIVFSALSIYDQKFVVSQYNNAQPIITAVTGAILVFAGIAYFFLRDLSRFLFLYFYIIDLILLLSWRKIAYRLLQQQLFQGWQPQQRVLIAGAGKQAQQVARAITELDWSGLSLAGFANDSPDALGPLDALPQLVQEHHIHEVIFTLPPGHQSQLQSLVYQLQPLSVNIRLLPDVVDLVFVQAAIEDFAGLPLIGLRQPAISPFNRLIKRLFDLVGSALLLLLNTPVFLVVGWLIKRGSDGPVFYRARRIGEGGRLFEMIKFRTMVNNAANQETELLVNSTASIGFDKRPDDPRVTKIGRFLRRTSLDEMPQLINVLKGDMSLVGPRPELPWIVQKYEPWQHQRLTVPQGITGWWQVNGRSNLPMHLNTEYDLFYIRNYSLWLDLVIMWRTLGSVIQGRGAY